MKLIKTLLEKNPDDIAALEMIQRESQKAWVYDLNDLKVHQILGLSQNDYSKINAYKEELTINASKNRYGIFPFEEINLKKFLSFSLCKEDLLKPFSLGNMKTEYSKKELYKIKNAVIITTPLSILVLDDKERIINQCSHNAAESVLIWYRKQKDKLKYSQHNKAMFIGVQQTFNMGHWFIDTVPLLEYGING